jgi:hypothetical protein
VLIDIDSGRVLGVPAKFKRDFDTLRSRLTLEQFESAVARINELIDGAGGEIATAGWLPGSDWTGSPFEPLYTEAARLNYDIAARFFGLLVWYTVMERPERWGSGRYEKDGKDIGSRTYFILRNP